MSDSCCIAIFKKESETNSALDHMDKILIEAECVSIINKHHQLGAIDNQHEGDIDICLRDSGVPESQRYAYRCIVDSGYTLLIIHGDQIQIEVASHHMEKLGGSDISVHFNHPIEAMH